MRGPDRSRSGVRNLAEHGEWALAHGIPANTATSPLNVWLLAAGILATGRPVVACGLLLMVLLGLSTLWLHRLGGPRAAVLGALFLATSPLLASTVGLETYLAVTVLIGMVRFGLAGTWPVVAVLVSAAVLARPDLLPTALVLVAGAAWIRRQVLAPALAVLVAAVAPLAWHLWTWAARGSFVPDTGPAKVVGASAWGPWRYHNGLGTYLLDFPYVAGLSVAAVVAGLVALPIAAARRHHAPLLLVAAGATSSLTFAMLEVAPAPYYGPTIAALGLAAVLVAVAPPNHAYRGGNGSPWQPSRSPSPGTSRSTSGAACHGRTVPRRSG